MASDVDESTNNVITRTDKFSTADSKVYSWLSLGNVGAGTVEWMWYSPDGNLYKTISFDIPPNTSGGYWSSYNIWSYLDIAGDIPADLPGNWHVDVYLVGLTDVTLLTEQFALEANAIQLNPDDAAAWDNTGNDLIGQGKFDEAKQAYDKAIEINPQYASAWTNKGLVLYIHGKFDEAIKAYDKAIEIDPQHASAWNSKGAALPGRGQAR
jgi:tetratricopeptide (TPR) repeat protein